MVTIYVRGWPYETRYGHLLTDDYDGVVVMHNPDTFPIHEAGHAVVGIAEGLGVKEIALPRKITPESEFGGGRTTFTVDYLHCSNYKATMAAGERAADRWLREQGMWTPQAAVSVEAGAYSDRQRAYSWQLLEAHDAADTILDRHWPAVLAVADALTRQRPGRDGRRLPGEAVADIVGSMDMKVEIT